LELKQDDKARVIIPPDFGYGSSGAGGIIPPEAFLEFTMEVIKIQK
jgi:peptidyl-prolyl cis-trans isomerase A (cyclophilin A)